MMIIERRESLLAQLLKVKSQLKGMAEQGENVSPAVKEVDRQIKQTAHGDPITGKGITKSDETEPSTS